MNDTPFIFDMNKITNFIFGNPNERTSDVEITENYIYDSESGQMVPEMKEVKEVKVNDYSNQSTIRYDMVKMFIEILNDVEDANVMTMGQNLTYNTMQAYGFIKGVKNE